jgi:circadian clock protein KaiC
MPRANPRSFFPTGIEGLDEVLGGGLRSGSLYLLYGPSGAGKTICGAQIGFNVARQGGQVLVVTLISESHGKLLDHLSGFDFFEESLIGSAVTFLNGYEALKEKGPQGLLELLTSLTSAHRPRLLVIEGFSTLRGLDIGDFDVAQFVYQLNALVTSFGCAALLVHPAPLGDASPEQALVDAIIEMSYLAQGVRIKREIQVHKHRAANPILGRNVFQIDARGIRVFPRLEAAVTRRIRPAPESSKRAAFGIRELDAMTQGGVVRGATTLVVGAPGAGKTLLGLKFLEQGLLQGEKALYFGFYESPPRLLGKAAGAGLAFDEAIARGDARFLWQPALEFVLDELGYKLLDAVREQRPQRIVIDGYEGFLQSAIRKERIPMFLTALMTELRALEIDVVLTQESGLLQHSGSPDSFVVSALVENVILLRYAEADAQLHRLISIIKMRESEYDSAIREFRISARGLEVLATRPPAAALDRAARREGCE